MYDLIHHRLFDDQKLFHKSWLALCSALLEREKALLEKALWGFREAILFG